MKLDGMEVPDGGAMSLQLTIWGADPNADVGEFDCCIVMIPPECYRNGALLLPMAGRGLIRASHHAAESVGEALHHAEWTITNNRDQVRTLGSTHGCAACIAKVDQATAFLAEHPDELVAVGQLWWTDD